MTVSRPFISVCIPSYNRPFETVELLHSILSEKNADYEVIICEDYSPEREVIKSKVNDALSEYSLQVRRRVHFYENERNLGYDGNIRELVRRSRGHYCFFMGNDDLVPSGALERVEKALSAHNNIGVVLRSYFSFDADPQKFNQMYQYFDSDRLFEPGSSTIATFFRRCVVISGLVVHRDSAQAIATEKFDGTLLYQLHLVVGILTAKHGLYLHKPLAAYRLGGVPDFGNSENEKDIYVPKAQTPESSFNFISGMLEIARQSENDLQVPIAAAIEKDLHNYSYPFLRIQRKLPRKEFFLYYRRLYCLGFGRSFLFHFYAMALFILGGDRCDLLIQQMKLLWGSTPRFGRLAKGIPIS